VNAGANVNAEFLDCFGYRLAASNGTRRTIKSRDESVARSVDFPAAMPLKLLANQRVMLVQNVFPRAVAKFGCSRG